MFGLPHSTEVNRRVPKESFYVNANLNATLRVKFREQIESIMWRHKLAESTMSVTSGDTVTEIQVFEIQLRQRQLERGVLEAMVKSIPYKLLFVLRFEQEAQAWIEAFGTFYHTEWLSFDALSLQFEGLNLDAVYAHLVHQLSDARLDTTAELSVAVERDRVRRQREREIAALERKLRQEKQFNRQIEINDTLKRLRKELGEEHVG